MSVKKEDRSVTVETYVDDKVYRDFSDFNAFQIGYRWVSLAVMPLLLLVLAGVNFATGSTALGVICTIFGLLAPLSYLFRYVVSVKNQIKKFDLTTPRKFYEVRVSDKGIFVKNQTEKTSFTWEQTYRVYEREQYFYIFITKARGFILPLKGLETEEIRLLKEIIKENLQPIRYMDRRKGRKRSRHGGSEI